MYQAFRLGIYPNEEETTCNCNCDDKKYDND